MGTQKNRPIKNSKQMFKLLVKKIFTILLSKYFVYLSTFVLHIKNVIEMGFFAKYFDAKLYILLSFIFKIMLI